VCIFARTGVAQVLVDALTYRAVTAEIMAELAGARIDRVSSPTRDSVFIAAGRGARRGLLISSSPASARLCLVDAAPTAVGATGDPSPFVMLLRKHLTGGRIIGIEQMGLDRVFRIDLEGWAHQSEADSKRLMIEILGRASNAAFLDADGRILDMLRREATPRREFAPGAVYVAPEVQNRPEPWSVTQAQFTASLMRTAAQRRVRGQDAGLAAAISAGFAGIGPALAAQVCGVAGVASDADPAQLGAGGREMEHLWEAFSRFAADAAAGRFVHEAAFKGDTPVACSSWGIGHMAAARGLEVRRYASACEMLEACLGAAEASEALGARRRTLARDVAARLDKVRRRAAAQASDLEKAEVNLGLKRIGDLITANLHSLGGGPLRTASVTLVDYYSPDMPSIEVDVDPALSAVDNAQQAYKRYAKAARAQDAIAEKLNETRNEEAYLESVLALVDVAESVDDIDAIRGELEILGYLAPARAHARIRGRQRSGSAGAAVGSGSAAGSHAPAVFTAKGGYDILVGRNNLQNDELTLKIARGHDLWFHVKDSPGSHVLLRKSARETVPDEAIIAAAMLAAYYSRERQSSNVAVDFTEARNVRKPRGAAPGKVIYDSQRTVYVTPSREGLVAYLT
jgi:predicted ribosome quality control (RQC) complex YloA/Tae2 family protein